MDLKRFSRSPIGRLQSVTVVDPVTEESYQHHAYIPEPLPSRVDLSAPTWSEVSEAASALARLDEAGSQLPNPFLLVRPTIRREAVSTSALEGTYAELSDLLEAEVLDEVQVPEQIAEVRGYIRAAELGLELLEARPLSLRLVDELHAALMHGTRGDSWDSGQVRSRQNWIGPHQCKITESYFVPPPPGGILGDGLREWEQWIHRDLEMPLLVSVSLSHYQFETLHPYIDGNGRIGRLIAILQLIQGGALRHHLLTISPYFEVRRKEYTDHLRHLSETGDWDTWIRFFVTGIKVQAVKALERVRELMEFRQSTRQKLTDVGLRGVVLRMADDLIGYPVITVPMMAKNYEVTYPAANAAVSKLVEVDVLREATGRRYARIFVASEVLRIIEDR